MAKSMREILRTINVMGKVSSCGKMGRSIEGNGLTASSMDWDCTKMSKEKSEKVSGSKVNAPGGWSDDLLYIPNI